MPRSEKSVALAGGVISVALIEALLDKGILTVDESRAILQRAMRGLAGFTSADVADAQTIIGDMLRGRFSAREQKRLD